MTYRRRRRRDDQGSIAVETAILMPALIAVMALIVVVGRLGNSKLDLDAAAQTAARTISMARSPADADAVAVAHARTGALETLDVGSPTCRSWTFDVTDTTEDVTVEITCTVDLSAASTLPVPGSTVLSARATEVLDRFKENSGGFGISEGSGDSDPRVGGV